MSYKTENYIFCRIALRYIEDSEEYLPHYPRYSKTNKKLSNNNINNDSFDQEINLNYNSFELIYFSNQFSLMEEIDG